MHDDLQDMHMALMAELTVYQSSKTSSGMDLAQTSACLQKSCRDSGMKISTDILMKFSSSPTATARSGGHAVSAQRVFHMFGKPMCATEPKEQAVLSAQAGLFVSTTRLPGRHRKLLCFGMLRRTTHCLQTK